MVLLGGAWLCDYFFSVTPGSKHPGTDRTAGIVWESGDGRAPRQREAENAAAKMRDPGKQAVEETLNRRGTASTAGNTYNFEAEETQA